MVSGEHFGGGRKPRRIDNITDNFEWRPEGSALIPLGALEAGGGLGNYNGSVLNIWSRRDAD